MKKVVRSIVIMFTALAILSLTSTCLAATSAPTPTETRTISIDSVSGLGWFLCSGNRNGFSISVMNGFEGPDGWNYAPTGYVHYRTKLSAQVPVFQVDSFRIWRFRVDSIDGGTKAVIVGIAQTRIGDDIRYHWYYRITVRSMDDGQDSFLIQLWRPIGADKFGGWSFSDFIPAEPSTLKLNPAPFYQARGTLQDGNIKIIT